MPTATKTRKARKPGANYKSREQLAELYAEATDGLDAVDVEAKAIRWLGRYSVRNSILILAQDPAATDVEGFKNWVKRGRVVRKGETSHIYILSPAGTEDAEVAKAEGRKPRQFFKPAALFTIEQTDLIEGATETPADEPVATEPAEVETVEAPAPPASHLDQALAILRG